MSVERPLRLVLHCEATPSEIRAPLLFAVVHSRLVDGEGPRQQAHHALGVDTYVVTKTVSDKFAALQHAADRLVGQLQAAGGLLHREDPGTEGLTHDGPLQRASGAAGRAVLRGSYSRAGARYCTQEHATWPSRSRGCARCPSSAPASKVLDSEVELGLRIGSKAPEPGRPGHGQEMEAAVGAGEVELADNVAGPLQTVQPSDGLVVRDGDVLRCQAECLAVVHARSQEVVQPTRYERRYTLRPYLAQVPEVGDIPVGARLALSVGSAPPMRSSANNWRACSPENLVATSCACSSAPPHQMLVACEAGTGTHRCLSGQGERGGRGPKRKPEPQREHDGARRDLPVVQFGQDALALAVSGQALNFCRTDQRPSAGWQ